MFVLFHVFGIEITQQILTQENFTNASFQDPNIKLYLIEDIDTSKLNMPFNTYEMIAELHGNNHTIKHSDTQPLFKQIKSNIFNATLNGYISDLIFFINIDFVTIQTRAFNLILNSNISHCIIHEQIATSIRNSIVSDIKLISNSALALSITHSVVQNVIMALEQLAINRSYLLADNAVSCNFSYVMITDGPVVFDSQIDSLSVITSGNNLFFYNSIIDLEGINVNSNYSIQLFHEFGTLTVHNTSFIFSSIQVTNVNSWSLITGLVNELNITNCLIKIGQIMVTSFARYTEQALLFQSTSLGTTKLTFNNNIVLVNVITYSTQNNVFLLSSQIKNSILINNTFEINQLLAQNITHSIQLLADHIENTKITNITFIQKQRQLYTTNIDNISKTTIALNILCNDTLNTTLENLQFVSFEDYLYVQVTTGNAKINTLANQWQNGSLTNISITLLNQTIQLMQNDTLTGTFQVSGISNIINNTKLENIFIDIKNFNILRNNNLSQTNTSAHLTGMGSTMLNCTLTNASVNINFTSIESTLDNNDIAFMLFTIGATSSTNTVKNVFGKAFNVQQNFYYGSFFLGNITNCYITSPNISRNPAEKCTNYTNQNLSGFSKVTIENQEIIYLNDLLYYNSSLLAVGFKKYTPITNGSYLYNYGKLQDQSNGTISVACTHNNMQTFTCFPQNHSSTSARNCPPFKLGYDCSLNFCFFLKNPLQCQGYFSEFNLDAKQTLTYFGEQKTFTANDCDGGAMIGSTCYCNIGYDGPKCNLQSCLYYLKENDVCYTTKSSNLEIQSICNYTGQCICHNRSYYVSNQNYQQQICLLGCPGLIHGICKSENNDAECYPGYTNADFRPGLNDTNIKCTVDGCAGKSDYENCTLYDNALKIDVQPFAQNYSYICYGGICINYPQLIRCQDTCKGGCMSYRYQLQCVNPCNLTEDKTPCLDIHCQNNCHGNGVCNKPTLMPSMYQQNDTQPFTVGTCTCYNQHMIGYCNSCELEYHFYNNTCLPNTCSGFYDAQTCQLRGGAVAGTVSAIILLILLAIALFFLAMFLLKRRRRINSLQNVQQSQHLETLHYQL